jgi:5'-nucleotidase
VRILLTNDDGMSAPGLAALERIAAALSDDVWVVAPETEQSGASHSLTLHLPLRYREVAPHRFAVQGTPTDSVVLAVMYILKNERKPDLVLSGVNRGSNIADDVTYSGTVAGAMEGTVLGIPSIALSQALSNPPSAPVNWKTAVTLAPDLIRRLVAVGWPADVLLNINFPGIGPEDVRGVEVTVQGQRDQSLLAVDARTDTRGVPYYWLAFERRFINPPDGTDLNAIAARRISVTPLHLNLTHSEAHDSLAQALDATQPQIAKTTP